MKKLFLLLVIVSFGLSLTACNSDITNGRKSYMKYFEYTLKDPESLKIYNEKVDQKGNYTFEFIVDYGAKNGYGGMTRETKRFVTEEGVLYSVDGDRQEALDFLQKERQAQ
ncbi:hypothetical protein ACQ1R0_03945 [Ornithobacterium rhinotracheale]|uniref:hypothetical protein n=1 Tax=Ornithobacterium rhinotracheale TaxID=28251 RepID=UPI0040370040